MVAGRGEQMTTERYEIQYLDDSGGVDAGVHQHAGCRSGAAVTIWGIGIDQGQRTPESEANARLIIAAPELLAACKGLLEACENAYGVIGAHEATTKVAAQMKAAEEAMAKAEGR